uniref:SERRATE_Ars2_N domain-containing protein n=1 Tax=Caenorhabditis japonica TaxID=281687 RepID=A0A8R1EGK2_CAEJA
MFRQKYKPDDAKKVKDALLGHIQRRLEVFNELKENGSLDGFTLDYGSAEAIIRMMDSVVVKLENGTEEELKAVLSQKLEDESLADVKKENNNGVGAVTETKEEEVKVGGEGGAGGICEG